MKKSSLTLLSLITLGSSLYGATLGDKIQNSTLIVYNKNIGLVHEERSLKMRSDESEIRYEDVASSINIDSVNVKLSPSINLLSQQYRYDKITQSKLLDAHIDKKVEVRIPKDRDSFKIITATLIAKDATHAIVRTLDYKILTVSKSDIIFSSIPSQLITKPSLVWNVQTKEDIDSKIELDYLIKNISWRANYILNLSGDKANLTGWINIDNRSGKSFKSVGLKVLAGDVNRISQPKVAYSYNAKRVMMDAAMPKSISHEGYHIYPVDFRVNLANNEKTQIKFLDKRSIDIEREYSAKLNNPLYLRGEIKSGVTQYVKIASLDKELPKGDIRSYSKLNHQSILLGESHIAHTPKDTPIKLLLGKNFDLKVTQTLLSRDDSKVRFYSQVKYSVKNSSDEDREVEVQVPFNKKKHSKIESSQEYKFKEGNLATFKLLVKANSTKEFTASFSTNR